MLVRPSGFRFSSLVLAALLVPQVARADDGESEAQTPPAHHEDEEPTRRQRWYGWQALIVDGGSLVVTPSAPPLGVAGYLLGGPIVHAAHGHWGTAGVSLLLRTGLPVVGAIVARGGQDARCGDVGCLRSVVGAGVGILAAIVIDTAALAWEPVPRAKDERSDEANASRRRPFAVAPGIAPRREGGVDLGLTGTF